MDNEIDKKVNSLHRNTITTKTSLPCSQLNLNKLLQRKILVQNITNLTDARYFAAWGVDYLSFNMIPDSEYFLPWEKISEIIEWVEGPQALIEANALEFLEGVDGHILSSMYSSLPLNKEAFFRIPLAEVIKGLPAGNYIVKIISEEDLDVLAQVENHAPGCNIFLDICDFDIKKLDKLPENGIVIQGGEEEKVGVKSFDELDIIYEWLLGE